MKKLRMISLLAAGITALSFRSYSQSTEAAPRDLSYDKISMEKEIIPYDHIREADVFWQKRIWRVIDSREKMNLPFRYEGVDWKET